MPKSPALRLYVILATLSISSFSYAQKTITGTVKDSKGSVVGATISVKGTTAVTLSGNDGTFSITLPKGRSSIIVSSVGFASKEVKVADNQSTITVDLTISNTGLDEVFVTGYTAQKKRDLTGAVSIIKTSDLTKVASPSFAQQLEGRASGVQISTSGAAGDGASVRIRGISTFTSNGGDPLVVIDGVQTKGQYFNDINSNDIESIQILKDAATTSAYGIGANNGVIIITTKKGKSGQPKIEYSGYYGTQTAVKGYDKFMIKTSQEYADLVFQSYNNAGLWPLADPADKVRLTYGVGPKAVIPQYLTPLGGTPSSPYFYSTDNATKNLITKANQQGTNWWDAVMHTAPITEQNVSASGGSDKGKYFLSFNYFNQQGTMRYTDFKRYTVRGNTEFKVKGFTLGENISLGFSNSVGQPGGGQSEQNILVSGILKQQPIIPVYDEGGNFAGSKNFGNGRNGLAELYRNKDNRGEFFKAIGNIYAEVKFLNHFSAKVNFGINYGVNFFKGFTFIDPEADEPRTANGFNERTERYNGWVLNEQLNYDNQIGNHTFKVTGLHEAQLNLFRGISGGLSNYFLETRDLWYLQSGLADPATRGVSSYGGTGPAKESYMGRLEYGYKGKYLLNATIRHDESSNFPILKGGTFGGAGFAWVVSDEPFMQNIKQINSLKLRIDYGTTGNDVVDGGRRYSSFGGGAGTTFYDINGTNTSTVTGYSAISVGNPGLKWETQIQRDFGIDALLFNNHIDLSVDFYNRTNKDFLFARTFPGTFPYDLNSPVQNLGKISNKGIEFNATWRNKVNKDFDYSVNVNFTHNKNKIEDLAAELGVNSFFALGQETRIGPLVRHEIGQPVSSFYGYTLDGIYQNAAEVAAALPIDGQKVATLGAFRWKDLNGDKQINDLDKSAIGNPNPTLVFGINLTAAYKGFDISMFLNGTQGNDIFNYTRYFTDFFGFNGNRSQRMLYESWTPTRTEAKLPLLNVNDKQSFKPSSYYIEDGSYIRCKSLQIGYRVPANVLKRVKIDNLRLYVQGQNLFTITKYTGLDPALGNRSGGNAPDPYFGVDGGNYPSSRLISIGANLSF
jgi:TonB-dependent starch-binding outer membrane protein SusC